MVLDEEEELLGDAKDPGRLVPREEPAVPLVPKIPLHLNLSFVIVLPNNPLRQVISDIIVERIRKCLWSSVEVVVMAALKTRVLLYDPINKELICPNMVDHAFCHLKDSCSW